MEVVENLCKLCKIDNSETMLTILLHWTQHGYLKE